MTVYLVISVPKKPEIHRIYMVLANSTYIWWSPCQKYRIYTVYMYNIWFWPTLLIYCWHPPRPARSMTSWLQAPPTIGPWTPWRSISQILGLWRTQGVFWKWEGVAGKGVYTYLCFIFYMPRCVCMCVCCVHVRLLTCVCLAVHFCACAIANMRMFGCMLVHLHLCCMCVHVCACVCMCVLCACALALAYMRVFGCMNVHLHLCCMRCLRFLLQAEVWHLVATRDRRDIAHYKIKIHIIYIYI